MEYLGFEVYNEIGLDCETGWKKCGNKWLLLFSPGRAAKKSPNSLWSEILELEVDIMPQSNQQDAWIWSIKEMHVTCQDTMEQCSEYVFDIFGSGVRTKEKDCGVIEWLQHCTVLRDGLEMLGMNEDDSVMKVYEGRTFFNVYQLETTCERDQECRCCWGETVRNWMCWGVPD